MSDTSKSNSSDQEKKSIFDTLVDQDIFSASHRALCAVGLSALINEICSKPTGADEYINQFKTEISKE